MSIATRRNENCVGEFHCTYSGFVHVDTDKARVVPKYEAVEKSFKMQEKLP